MEEKIVFVGKVPRNEVPCYYQVADVFVTASVTETQGLTVIEAMAAGKTPVCINDESFRNTVVDGLNGRLFETKKEYINIITELYENRQKLQQLSRQARINSERYSAKYYAEGVLDVYKHALSNKKNKYGILGRLFSKLKGE